MEIDWKTLFTSPAGRIKRQTYWIAWAIQFAVGLVVAFVVNPISVYAGAALSVLLLYPLYCVYAKRLQDMGKPGVIAAIPVLLSLVSVAMSIYMVAVLGVKPSMNVMAPPDVSPEKLGAMMTIGFVSMGIGLVGLVFWLVLGIAGSQQGPNKYGPEPGEDDGDEVFN